jgi:hypothetical protein
VPEVELLWWAGCPSTERAIDELRSAMQTAGLEAADLKVTEIKTDEDADVAGFLGSPTVRIDGEDLAPAGPGDVVGLSCRVYRRRDGRISPTPDPDDLLDALRAAQGKEVTR